jgi:hypothetical protein
MACNGLLWEESQQDFEYYDSFAHIDLGEPFIFETAKDKQNHDKYVHHVLTHRYTAYEDPRHVLSAFGGCCLYKMTPFCKSRYDFSNQYFSCEHAFFHSTMKEGVMVNPHFLFLILENN